MRTPGFSGADLENLLNEAALVTARHNKKRITMEEIDEAIDRVIAGPAKKSRVVSEKERKIVAYHESGHTVIGMVLDDADRSEERRVGKECGCRRRRCERN